MSIDEAKIQKKQIFVNKISLNDYIIKETVGTGSYGRVHICRNKKTNKIYALKILKKTEILRLKQVDHIYSEYTILSMIYHPFIIEMKGVNTTDQYNLYFLLEYIPGGELFSLLRSMKNFPTNHAKFYSAHIVKI